MLHNIAVDRKLPDFQPCQCELCVDRRRRNGGNDDAEDMPQDIYDLMPAHNQNQNIQAFRQQYIENFFARN